MVKVVAEAGGGQVLGAHPVGPNVSGMIAESRLVVAWDARPSDVARHLRAHPPLSEAVGEAARRRQVWTPHRLYPELKP